MRNIILFLFLFVSFALNAQSTLDKRYVLVAEWQDYVLLNDSMWRVNTNFADDQLNSGYLPTQIQVGYLALDATGRRYRIKQVGETTFSSAVLDVVEEADLNMPPIGVGIVYAPNLRDVIHSVVHSNTQISPSLMSKIFIHNMIKLDEISLLASDFTRLEQDSIIVYYNENVEFDRDTIRLNIVSALAALSDVNVSGVADKGILYYDLATQQWRDTVSSVYLSGTGSVNRIPYYSAGSTLTNSANLTFDGTALNVNSAAVFNDAGAAVNFRVESDNDENKIFVSGSTDRVGIGTNSPTNTLDIDGTLRIRTLNAVTSTGILGIDANGVAERITLGSGLSLVNDVLTATGTLSGSGVANQVAFWNGTSSLSGSNNLTVDANSNLTSTRVITGRTLGSSKTGGVNCSVVGIYTTGQATTGMLEIILPSTITAFNQFRISFTVSATSHSTLQGITNYYVNINGFTPNSSSVVIKNSNVNNTLSSYKIGFKNNRYVLYLERPDFIWGFGIISIKDVSISGLSNSVIDLCEGWSVNITTDLSQTTVVYDRLLTTYDIPSLVSKSSSHSFDNLKFSTYFGNLSGSMELTINKRDATGAVNGLIIRGYISYSSLDRLIEFKINAASLNLTTLAWGNVSVEYPNGNPNNSRYVFRFGDDGTNLKIWIGELTQAWSGGHLIAISDIYGYQTSREIISTLSETTNWSFSLETTSFDNIDRTVNPVITSSIPYSGILGHEHSANLVYDNTNTRLGIGTSSPSYSLDIPTTNAIRIPLGTTAQRPTGAAGVLRLNTTTTPTFMEYHNGTAFRRVVDVADANPATGDMVSYTGSAYSATSSRRGIITGTPDGSGDFTLTFATAMPDNTYTATAISEGTTAYIISVHTKATGSVKFRIFNDAGVPVTSGTITINYSVTDY